MPEKKQSAPAPAVGFFIRETPVDGLDAVHIIILFLLLVALFELPASSATSGKGAAVTLDSIDGKAEVQRSGSTQWTPIAAHEPLNNNDIVRILPGGVGLLRWSDKTVAFMRGGSRILVSLARAREKSRLRYYPTLLSGTVFFVVRKTLPREPAENIRVFTPTSVIDIEGTSLEISVEPATGATGVKMVCGTARVKCIETRASVFLRAPLKTVITKHTDTIITSVVLSADLDSLRMWAPHDVVDNELVAQLAQGKRDRLIVSGIMDEKCIIIPFANKSKYEGAWDIERRIPHMLAERLRSANMRLNLEVTDSAGLTPDNAAVFGKARFVVSGAVTFFDIVNHVEITARADEYHERSVGRIDLELLIFDAVEKTVRYEKTVSGERSGKKTADNSWAAIAKMPFDLKNDRFAASIIGSALDQALDAAVENLINALYK